ncbi:hypothetical protein AB5N19_13896 [Seiridium cardinale]|uniref:Uncharacterized protein n=1 Tax=Seiridium cardinale TaxID=138064 RepID=A0ABR2XJJ7_9PEZI
MVVNISDTFQRWTNNDITPGFHQVSAPASHKANAESILPARHSCVFFFKASRNVSVSPLPEFVGADKPAEYDKITALTYQERRTEELY